MNSSPTPGHGVRLSEAFRAWLKIGLLSFGGPAGQIALMHRIVVDEKKWVSESRFLHALNYCMLLPGPEAQQLAIYLGWLLHRIRGGVIAGVLFVLPGALIILAISILYVRFRELPLVEAGFYGIKSAILAVVLAALLRIGKKVLHNIWLLGIAGAAFIALFVFGVAFPAVVISAAIVGFIGGRIAPAAFAANSAAKSAATEHALDREFEQGGMTHTKPSFARAAKIIALCLALWFGPLLALGAIFGATHVYVSEGVFFSKMAVVTFGGAYAVLAYMAQQAVGTYGWVSPGEMLDGLGLAETTPGPLIMVVQFIGFLAAYRNPGMLEPMLAGVLGAALATWVTFVPCFLWIFLGAPYIESLRGNRQLSAALAGITAAIVGVMLNLSVWFGMHVLFGELRATNLPAAEMQLPLWATIDPWSAAVAVLALVLLQCKVGIIKTLAASVAVGGGFYWAG